MILSSMELLYLAAYWILVYEYVSMRHWVIFAESDARIDMRFETERLVAIESGELDAWEYKCLAQAIYWNRGTK